MAYALPTGPTGTLPAASDLPASQRTGLRFDWGESGKGVRVWLDISLEHHLLFVHASW